jgi:hypothetical protein
MGPKSCAISFIEPVVIRAKFSDIRRAFEELRCGLAVVDLTTGETTDQLWFYTGLEEIFSVILLPGWRNPAVIGPDNRTDATQTVWMVPPSTP